MGKVVAMLRMDVWKRDLKDDLEFSSRSSSVFFSQVKKSTLNPNAKEFVFKAPMTLVCLSHSHGSS